MDNDAMERVSLTKPNEIQPDIVPRTRLGSCSVARKISRQESIMTRCPSMDSSVNTEGPDGGFWAWIVVLGSFLTNGIIFGCINCYGVMFTKVQEQFAKDHADAKFLTASVGSTTIGMTFCFSFVASIMTDRFGIRKTAVLGGILATCGMFASSFATSIFHLYFTYGVLLGLGCSFAYTPSLVILGHYFSRRLGIVNGVVTAGSSLFTMTMAIALSGILQKYSLQTTFRILGGLMAVLILAGFTFIEKKKQRDEKAVMARKEKQPMFNTAIWKDKLYVVWVIAIPIALFGYFVPYVHLVEHVKSIYQSSNITGSAPNGELLVTTLGASSGIGRVIFGPISDSMNRIVLQQLAFVTIGVLTMLLIIARQFYYLVLICVGLGLADGCFISVLGPIAFDLVGASGASQAIGFLLAFCSIPLTVGPPFAGYLFDVTGNYNLAFLCAGLPPFFGAALMMLILRWQREPSVAKIAAKMGVGTTSSASTTIATTPTTITTDLEATKCTSMMSLNSSDLTTSRQSSCGCGAYSDEHEPFCSRFLSPSRHQSLIVNNNPFPADHSAA